MLVLKPRKLDERLIKLQQKNKRLLMNNDFLEFNNLFINESWNFKLESNLIKCKKIVGCIWLQLNNIPSWIKDIEINGSFFCNYCNLTSLENCPKIIQRSFYCNSNKLTTLDDGPIYVGYNYDCNNNSVKFTEKYVKSICIVKKNIFV